MPVASKPRQRRGRGRGDDPRRGGEGVRGDERRHPAASQAERVAMTAILEDIVAEGERLLALASDNDVDVRLLGGVAVRLHAQAVPPALDRQYKDLDFAVPKKAAAPLDQLLRGAGY